MKNIILTLNRIFALEFYRLNAAFFLVLIGLCAGFMSGVEHQALAAYFTSSPFLLLVPVLCWFFYAGKVISFNQKTSNLPENIFIRDLFLLKRHIQWATALPFILSELMPIILYSIFLALVAIDKSMLWSVALISIVIIMIVLMTTIAFIRTLNHSLSETKVWALRHYLNSRFSRFHFQFFIEWIVRRDFAVLMGTKLFSCLLLLAITNLYQTDRYDWRLLAMGLTIAFAGHLVLIFHFQRFEEIYLSFIRNLPLSIVKRLLNFILVFTLISLPDFGLIIRNFPSFLSTGILPFTIVFGISIFILIYGYLYTSPVSLEKLIQRSFALIIIILILILFNIPLWVISVVLLTTGSILYKKHYYAFEFIAPLKSKNNSQDS